MAQKRRVLEKLKLTEISGVDRPCQEGARVAIMKRAPDRIEGADALALRVERLHRQMALLNKFDPHQPRDEGGRWSEVGAAAGRLGAAVTRTAGAIGR